MAVKIKLMRMGKMRAPYYRVVIADARTRRDGRAIETIGKYHPKEDPSFIEINSERALYWLGVGAQPTEAVAAILRVTGDWQRFRGEPAPEPMKVRAPRADRKAVFEAAAREGVAAAEATAGATTPRKRAKRPDDPGGTPPASAPAAAPEPATESAPQSATESATESAPPTPPASVETVTEGAAEPATDPAPEPATAGTDETSGG